MHADISGFSGTIHRCEERRYPYLIEGPVGFVPGSRRPEQRVDGDTQKKQQKCTFIAGGKEVAYSESRLVNSLTMVLRRRESRLLHSVFLAWHRPHATKAPGQLSYQELTWLGARFKLPNQRLVWLPARCK